MAKWSQSPTLTLSSMIKNSIEAGIVAYEKTAIEIAAGVLNDTPVGEPELGTAGNLKANWQIARKTNDRYFKSTRKPTLGKEYAHAKIAGKFSTKHSSRLVMFNNAPQANVVEYGGYPNPPKKGTYIPGRGYVRLSQGGFSKKAPKGMVRINALRFKSLFRKNYVSSR